MSPSIDWPGYVRRYALTQLSVALVIFGSYAVFAYDLGSAGATVVPVVLASMSEGRLHARAVGHAPRGVWAWRQALFMGLVGAAVTMAFAAFFMTALSRPMAALLTPEGFEALSPVTGLMVLLFVLAARLFLHMGARSELKSPSRGG